MTPADSLREVVNRDRAPARLWSLWDMINLNASRFMALIANHRSMMFTLRGGQGEIDRKTKDMIAVYADGMQDTCDELSLPISSDLTQYIKSAKDFAGFMLALEHVERTIHSELKARLFFEPDPKYKGYFEQDALFGGSVFEAFPSANNDVFEAGTCLALERGTACVMHLMRVMEAGLAALAATVGVPKQNDWGSYLREIEKELVRRAKTSGARSDDEQFYAEAAASFDHVRRAWRNPTMHIENTYSPERAREILEAVKSFMSHLATRISEPSPGQSS